MDAMTVKDMKDQLNGWPDDWKIEFSGLTFFRLKKRAEKMANMEFNELFRVIEPRTTKREAPLLKRQ